ncbi:MAG: methionine adenosyltransferase [Deltaproteobacteria bacterium]|nr:methionine adenosyltransferase [Deltaproteobacteria bacterium]
MGERHLFTSESVTEGHPDKICDQISDGIVDACLSADKQSRVAAECLVKTGMAVIAGEITTRTWVDMPALVRSVIRDVGYSHSDMGFDWETCAVLTAIEKQSPDIARGVDRGDPMEQGAGDQGLMFGFACRETTDLMPLPIMLAHAICRRLAELRKSGEVDCLRPDGKSQVTVEYQDGKPRRVHTVVCSTQHTEEATCRGLRDMIVRDVIRHAIPEKWLDRRTIFHVNPTGRFVLGGPFADTGVTGRKIIVDTYGGYAPHGGGAFSGKDPSKVDRSATYYARYVAKNLVAAGAATRCQVQIAYAIGVAQPVSVLVDTFGTARVPEKKLAAYVREAFDMRPRAIIQELQLLTRSYRQTAAYGHFGRRGKNFTWESTSRAARIAKDLGLK